MQLTKENDLRVVISYMLNEIASKKRIRKEAKEKVYQKLDKDEILKRVSATNAFGLCRYDTEQEIIDANDAFGEIVDIWSDFYPSWLQKISIATLSESLKEEGVLNPSLQEFHSSWNRIKNKIEFNYEDTKSRIEDYFSLDRAVHESLEK